jgi:hypothetical protein
MMEQDRKGWEFNGKNKTGKQMEQSGHEMKWNRKKLDWME